VDFHVAGALELFVDHVVHAAAGVDQGGGDDGQRAAFLDVASGAEEALRLLQGVGVDAAGQHLAGGRHHGVVGAGQAGDRVEQDDHVLLVLDQALGLLDDHLGDLDVAGGRLVEGRGHDLALDRALISVTSSGRSSISSTISTTSGWLEVIAWAMCCSITVLPLFGGRPAGRAGPCRWGDHVDDAAGDVFLARISRSSLR
jgi:hypothetical protein